MTRSKNGVLEPDDEAHDRGASRLFEAIDKSGWTKYGTRIEVHLPSPKLPSHRWRGGRTHVVRRSPTQVLGLDQHPHAMAHIVDVAEFKVEVTEADEAVRNALCFLTCDEELPSVEAERAFLAYGRDGRDVRVCVEIKILRRFVLNRRVDLHAIDATPARWRGDAGSSSLDGANTAASSRAPDALIDFHTARDFAGMRSVRPSSTRRSGRDA